MTTVDILSSLPLFIEKMFEILSTNSKHDVYDMALYQMKSYLNDYEKCKGRSINLDIEIIRKILKFLNKQKSPDIDKNKYLAIIWLDEFVKYFEEDLKNNKVTDINSSDVIIQPYNDEQRSEEEIVTQTDVSMLYNERSTATIPALALAENQEVSKEEDKQDSSLEVISTSMHSEQNNLSTRLFTELFPEILVWIMNYVNTENEDASIRIKNTNTILQKLVINYSQNSSDFYHILFKLRKHFKKGRLRTREVAIDWFTMLFRGN